MNSTNLIRGRSCARVVYAVKTRNRTEPFRSCAAANRERTVKFSTMANPSISAAAARAVHQNILADNRVNPYEARYATLADANAIDLIVNEAFGDTATKSSAAREIRRNKMTYIVVTKASGANPTPTGANGRQGKVGWQRRLRSLFSSSIGGLESQNIISNVVGLVGIWTALDQAHIVVIATHPNEQRRGVGELLVLATITEALKVGATNATLEVRKSNTVARSLYRKYGFNDVGIRHRYYHDNREDAIIMSTPSFSNLEYKRSFARRWKGYVSARGKTELQFDPTPYLALPE